ncbi:MAG: SCP2 sterol-binding domain-containing protein [Thermoplasmata archaeon]|nr:SCP2 sterol-binding domain-containing protein [Thermoplasmata archaeon]MBE3136991.1 SCP2 sterol-binding domain-containing protein [Thermoplasmata archaeon]MBE3139496.1 SCP2 sterol-binding domain-containing protein [Thermoplasmata archaeon]MCJ7697098.1 SCP2 sterol-binding domain-containing protein [Thermoplasmata archaeon]
MVKYLSEEWAAQAKKKVLDELDQTKDLKNMNASLLNVVQNVPPDQKTVYFYIRFVDGKLEELLASPDESIKQKNAEFTITGDYTTFVQISSGQMSSAMALLKNRVKMTGNKIKAFTITKPIDTFNMCIKKIETEY